MGDDVGLAEHHRAVALRLRQPAVGIRGALRDLLADVGADDRHRQHQHADGPRHAQHITGPYQPPPPARAGFSTLLQPQRTGW